MAALEYFYFLQNLGVVLDKNDWAGQEVLQKTLSYIGERLDDHILLFQMYGTNPN